MTSAQLNGHDAPPGTPTVPRDTSFEHALDEDAPDAVPVHDGDGIAIPHLGGERRDIIPVHLRTLKGILGTCGKYLDAARFHTVFHLLRLPLYLILGVIWAVAGVARIGAAQLRWWWVTEQAPLRSLAVVGGQPAEWRSLHNTGRKTRSWRGSVIGGEVAAIVLAGVLIASLCPWWAWLAVAAAVMPPLAHAGRPEFRPIISPAVTTPLVRKISTDAIVRAYWAAGLCNPEKPGQDLQFGSVMSRDALDRGSQVVIHLPYGKTTADAITQKAKIASGLDVRETQVYITPDHQSERRHALWVADTDPLAEPAGPTPLLDCKQRSIWRRAPFGLDQYGRKVTIPLMWHSVLIGAQPRRGKTFAARLLALYAALDPYVKITIIDGKSSPDWKPFRYVAHRYVRGTHPDKSGDPVGQALAALYEIDRHIVTVNDELSSLPASEVPEAKLTEKLYRKNARLRVWMLVMEEFQVYFELEDQKKNKEFAAVLSRLQAMGPSAGVVILSSSQKPSGVGAGDVQRLFNRYRDNHQLRFALRCGNRDVSMAILGSESYSDGYDASSLPLGDKFRGVGILYGLTDDAPTVRTFLADGEDAEVILLAARKMRERARTLSGDAVAAEPDDAGSDIVADLLEVMGGDAGLWWETAALRLAGAFPMRHADANAESVSAAARARGVPSGDIRWPPGRTGTNRKGCRKADLAAAVRS
jgi:hypothetical protein